MKSEIFLKEQEQLKKPIKRLLQSIELDHYNIIDIPSIMYSAGGKRTIYSIVVNTPKENKNLKIIIDMIEGIPTEDQIMESACFGADCRHNIIVMAIGDIDIQNDENYWKISDYIEAKNQAGFSTYRVEAVGLEVANIKESHDFKVIDNYFEYGFNYFAPSPANPDEIDKAFLLRHAAYREALKSSLFYDYHHKNYRIAITDIKGYSGITDMNVNSRWDNEGMFLIIEWEDNRKYSNNKLWDDNKDTINHQYAGCSVKFKRTDFSHHNIVTIHLNDIPDLYAVSAPIQEQEHLFEFIRNAKGTLANLVAPLVGGVVKYNSGRNMK